jgi:ribonucleoside-triphosphate reductase
MNNINQSLSEETLPIKTSIGLELVIPEHLKEKEAIGTNGKILGRYEDYTKESNLIASLLFEILSENKRRPFFNPSLIIKMRSEALKRKKINDIINKVHRIAAWDGTPYFANLFQEKQLSTSYNAAGSRLSNDWTEDWELDTLQTGKIGGVFMNLPRIGYEAETEEGRFFELLDDLIDTSVRTLEIKDSAIKQYTKDGLLPFLTQENRGNKYFRYENESRQLSFIGLNEAVESLSGAKIFEKDSIELTERILTHILKRTSQFYRRPKKRLVVSSSPNPFAAKRLAELDLERYGRGKIHTQGTKEDPFYTDMVGVPLEESISLGKRLDVEEKIHQLTPGGHLAIIQISDLIEDQKDLIPFSMNILNNRQIGLYTYSRNLTYCIDCQNSFKKILPKCPVCGTTNKLASFGRMSAKYVPLSHWLTTKTYALKNRISYSKTGEKA